MRKNKSVGALAEVPVGEYRLTRGWCVVSWFGVLILFGGGSWLFLDGLLNHQLTDSQMITQLICGGFLALISLFSGLSGLTTKLIIANDQIISRGVLKTRFLPFVNIDGVRMVKYGFTLSPKEGTRANSVTINRYIRNYGYLLAWAYNEFDDLDKRDKKKQWQEFVNDEDFGLSKKELVQESKKIKNIIKPLDNLTYILLAVLLFFPSWRRPAITTITAFIPLLGIAIYLKTKGLAKIYTEDDSPYPSLCTVTFIAMSGLGLRALFDCNVIDYTNFWAPFALVSSGLFFLCMYHERLKKDKKLEFCLNALSMAIFCIGYSYAVIVLYNDILDDSEPDVFLSEVVDKHYTSGKSSHHDLTLAPWGPIKEEKDTRVGLSTYKSTEIGDKVEVYLYKGRFNLPYYYLDTNH